MTTEPYAPGTCEGLLRSVSAAIAAMLTEVRLPSKEGSDPLPLVIKRMHLDVRKQDEEPEEHVLFVAFAEESQSAGDHGDVRTGRLGLLLRIRMEEYGDDEYAVAIMERIQAGLLAQRVLPGGYRLQLPLSWQAIADPEDQPWPYWMAMMAPTYEMPAVAEVAMPGGASINDLI